MDDVTPHEGLNDEARRILGLEAQRRKNARDTALCQRDSARKTLERYQEAYEKAQAAYEQLEEFTPASPEQPKIDFQSVKPYWEFDNILVRKDESYSGANDNLTARQESWFKSR